MKRLLPTMSCPMSPLQPIRMRTILKTTNPISTFLSPRVPDEVDLYHVLGPYQMRHFVNFLGLTCPAYHHDFDSNDHLAMYDGCFQKPCMVGHCDRVPM